jgi:hypothetical protein
MKMDSIGAGRRSSRTRASAKTKSRNISPSRPRSGGAAKKAGAGRTGRSSAARGQTRSRTARSSGSAKSTTNLNEIRQWAEARDGKPVSVIGTARGAKAGLLRIDFPGYSGAGRLKEVSWEDWYQKFQESNLEFLYQDKKDSRFFKLVSRGGSKRSGSSSRRSRSGSTAKRKAGSR